MAKKETKPENKVEVADTKANTTEQKSKAENKAETADTKVKTAEQKSKGEIKAETADSKGKSTEQKSKPESNAEAADAKAKPAEQKSKPEKVVKIEKLEPFISPLKEKYHSVAIPEMKKKFGYTNVMQVPKVLKVIVNMGVGEGSRNKDLFTVHSEELMTITGQKPVITKAKHAISNFKIRKGMPVGIKVTLRGYIMENFLYKLFNIVLPKVRDFRGLNPNSFDGKGNYSFGLSEQIIFPEIKVEKVKRLQGMDIIIVTSAKNNEESKALLGFLGLPFKRA